jgi:hypothetical protein
MTDHRHMPAAEVRRIYTQLQELGIPIWIDGGWGVDALLGQQTRTHGDLDIAVEHQNLAEVLAFLTDNGYSETRRESKWNAVMSDSHGHDIDIHSFLRDRSQNIVEGIQYPIDSLIGTGVIDGLTVRCVSPEHAIHFREAYESRDKDIQDVAALRRRYGAANGSVGTLKIWKVKRPAGRSSFDLRPLGEDEFGVWLHGPKGSPWYAPHATGVLSFNVLTLLSIERCWVGWWVDDPANRRLEIDICLKPQRESDGWSYIDLELDPIRYENGVVEIVDRDEFEEARRRGWMSSSEAEIADRTATAMADVLHKHIEPFGVEGWQRLQRIGSFAT